MKKIFHPSFFFCLLIVIALSGCNANITQPAATSLPSLTLKRTASSTSIVSIPSLTPSQTVLFTSVNLTGETTPISTPKGDDPLSKVQFLIKTNGTCNLPCWWGITPGKTKWSEANEYLQTFSSYVSRGGVSQYYPGLVYRAEFPNPGNTNQSLAAVFYVEVIDMKKGAIDIINPLAMESIPSLLSILGMPEQLWINIEVLDTPNFTLVIFYQTGEMLVYRGQYQIDNNQFFTICPKNLQDKNANLWLWDPVTGRSFTDIGKLGAIPPLTPSDYFKSLDDVSETKPIDFYHMFIDPTSHHCIKTPISKWVFK